MFDKKKYRIAEFHSNSKKSRDALLKSFLSGNGWFNRCAWCHGGDIDAEVYETERHIICKKCGCVFMFAFYKKKEGKDNFTIEVWEICSNEIKIGGYKR